MGLGLGVHSSHRLARSQNCVPGHYILPELGDRWDSEQRPGEDRLVQSHTAKGSYFLPSKGRLPFLIGRCSRILCNLCLARAPTCKVLNERKYPPVGHMDAQALKEKRPGALRFPSTSGTPETSELCPLGCTTGLLRQA